MQKDSTITMRVDSELKSEVENILNTLGIPMTTAITMYFNQIKMRKGIPFQPIIISKPKAYEDYSAEEIAFMCDEAKEDYLSGKSVSSEEVEKIMKERMKNDL